MSDIRSTQNPARGFAVISMEENNKQREFKKEKPEYSSDSDLVLRVVPVFQGDITEISDSDDWSDPTDVQGPTTTDALTLSATTTEKKPIAKSDKKITKARKKQKKRVKKSTPVKNVNKKVKPMKAPRKYKAIGRTITQGDKSYELMFDMLLGIRISVSGVSAKKKNEITRNDISEVSNYFMPSAGTVATPAHPGRDFQFTDYAPKVFRDLREKHGIDSADYLISLTADYVLSEIVSPGKSGSFFYFSHDTKYMLKTITTPEKRFLKKILRAYYQHVMDNPDTLVIRFYGFHMVQPHGGPKMYFVVMGNIFAQSLEIHKRYDLKGSTTGRTVGEEGLKNLKSTTILKDLDWDGNLIFGKEKQDLLFSQLEKDAEFLQRQDIMDYSLLLGIHSSSKAIQNTGEIPNFDEPIEESERMTVFTKDHGGFRATNENNEPLPEIYFMGIIDILQPYNISKQVEHTWKSSVLRMNKFEISAVSPTLYAERFLKFIKNHVSTEGASDILEEYEKEVELLNEKKEEEKRSRSKKRRKKSRTHSQKAFPSLSSSRGNNSDVKKSKRRRNCRNQNRR